MPGNLSKPVIGLAGGIGSGKSYVAAMLADEGCFVVDSDRAAAEVLAEPQVQQAVAEAFGSVDRAVLARKVFSDEAALKTLENIIHPRVHQRREVLRHEADSDADVVAIVEDCPLLFERGLDAQCDVVIFVACPRETRLERVAKRGWSETNLDLREKNQLSLDLKRKKADYVIINDADTALSPASLRRQVRQILAEILPNPT